MMQGPLANAGRVPLEMVVALLPRREREAVAARFLLDVRRGSWTGGLLGAIAAGVAWVIGLITAMRDVLSSSSGQLRDFSAAPVLTNDASPLQFVMSPLGLVLAYVTLTSSVRWVHAALNSEPLADPLLALAGWLARVARGSERRRLARLGPPRPDRVSAQDGCLVVLTARDKPEWNPRVTIEVSERFYRVAAIEERPDGDWIALAYLLEPVPAGTVFRSLVQYTPPGPAARATVLPAAPPAPAGPAMRATMPPDAPQAPSFRVPPPAPPRDGARWYVDDGEEARLTPGGPCAAVIESLGSLPLRARAATGEGRLRPTFPGTAVLLGEDCYEVIGEEVLETGARYRLDPWPADHIRRDMVRYGPRLVRAAQRERDQVVDVERARRWSWLLYPFVGLLPETRQILACERLGLDAAMATLCGAVLEALALIYGALLLTSPLEAMRSGGGMGFGWVDKAGWLLALVLIRAFGALAFGEVGGSLLLGFAFEAAQVLKPSAPRYDTSVLPLTRDAFWARLALPDRQERQDDGSILVTSLLAHLSWGTSANSRLAAGQDWWSVERLPPVIEKGRLTYRYRLVLLGDRVVGEPQAPGPRTYQDEVTAEIRREWDDLLFAGSWLVCLLPEDVQQRAYGWRGGPAASRTATLVTAVLQVAAGAWFLRPSFLDLLTAAFLFVDGGRRLTRAWSGRYGPSLAGGLISDLLRPERRSYHAHRDAEREARAAVTRVALPRS